MGAAMKQNREAIIDRIQKLLALANSSNEHEATAAANRAQALLVKYNLTMNDVEVEEGEQKYMAEKIETDRARISTEWKYIQSLLQEFYFIRIVHSKKPAYSDGMPAFTRSGRLKTYVVYLFIGKPHNVKIAQFVKDFLTRAFKDLFEQYKKQTGAENRSRDSYYAGLYKGLCEQLKATQKQVEDETGLVVVEDPGLDKHINDMFNKLKSRDISTNVHDPEAIKAGTEDGKKLRIARGLDGNQASPKQVGEVLKIGGTV